MFPPAHRIVRRPMSPRYDVALFAWRATPLYTDPPGPSPGGAEVQVRYLARALASCGMRVCHIVADAPNLPSQVDGVDLVRLEDPRPQDSKAQRSRQVLASLREADASVYVERSAGSFAGLVALYARLRRRSYVLSSSWDGDLTQPIIPGRVAQASFRLGVRLADTIVMQTQDQMRAASALVDRPLTLIRSIAEQFPDAGASRRAFLWIGRAVDYKDPLAYLDLADRVPEARFWMVADTRADADPGLSAEIRRRAEASANLELLPVRPREQLGELYDQAVAVVNTSTVEGFPNTFMEGWARGTPALSLRLDPDRIISRHGLGACAGGSMDVLARAAAEAWESGGDRGQSERARTYIASEHAAEVIGAQWRELITRIRASQ